jgi:hypothetical protein
MQPITFNGTIRGQNMYTAATLLNKLVVVQLGRQMFFGKLIQVQPVYVLHKPCEVLTMFSDGRCPFCSGELEADTEYPTNIYLSKALFAFGDDKVILNSFQYIQELTDEFLAEAYTKEVNKKHAALRSVPRELGQVKDFNRPEKLD